MTAQARTREKQVTAILGDKDQALAACGTALAQARKYTRAALSREAEAYDNQQRYLAEGFRLGQVGDQQEAEAVAGTIAYNEGIFKATWQIGDPIKGWATDAAVDTCLSH